MAKRVFFSLFILLFLLVWPVLAQQQVEILFEDYNDQDIFNNLSGDWNKWEHTPGGCEWSFDTENSRGDTGACLKVEYSVPLGGYGGIWNSLISKINYDTQSLDFTNLYGDLKNSSSNPTKVEDVQVTKFSFWAKGNGLGDYPHIVKLELKDVNNKIIYKNFRIPNLSGWTKYEFDLSEAKNIDFSRMKEVVFVVADYLNNFRSSYFFIDDLTITTTEPTYDASKWDDDKFLDLVEQRTFKYFLTYVDELGFALDRSTFSDLVSVGAIGFQLTAYCIGHQRGWAEGLEDRVENILYKLYTLPMGSQAGTVNAGYRGFFYHFLEANTGRRKNKHVELSLYDTMLLMYGVLTCKEYFSENENIQKMAQQLYDAVEWDWMVDQTPGRNYQQFHMAWKPEIGFEGHLDGYTDEALLVDVLALGSTTHPSPMSVYHSKLRIKGTYPEDSNEPIVAAWTGSLFNYFFASCWLDLKNRGTDKHETYPLDIWENNKRAIIANRKACIDMQDKKKANGDDKYMTYGPNSWGLTACDNLVDPSTGMLSEYYAFGAMPAQQNIQYPVTKTPHVGTVAVYGAGSAIMYTPKESIEALRHYYSSTTLWSPLVGFGDAYSLDPHYFEVNTETYQPVLDEQSNLIVRPATWLKGPWVNHMIMGVNEGPMLLAIENHRSGMIWWLTNMNANLQRGLDRIFGLQKDTSVIPNTLYSLEQALDSMEDVKFKTAPQYPPSTTAEVSR